MHGITNCLNKLKKSSRESTPTTNKESDENRSISPSDGSPRVSLRNNEPSKRVPIAQRRNSGQRSLGHSPQGLAGSPPWQEEARGLPIYFRRHSLSRTQSPPRVDFPGPSSAPKHDYRHFVSPLYNDVMDDIQENDYNKCELYGEISTDKLDHRPYADRFDNKDFALKLVECSKSPKSNYGMRERRESGGSTHKHKHQSIQDLIRSFGKKMGSWRHETSGRRSSCAVPTATVDVPRKEDIRGRSKSLDPDHLHSIIRHPILDDCGETYRIFDAIIQQGVELRRERAQEAAKRRSSLDNCSRPGRHRGSNALIDPERAAMLFRDARGLPVADPFIEKLDPDGAIYAANTMNYFVCKFDLFDVAVRLRISVGPVVPVAAAAALRAT
ncbi:hypothetical protein RR46_08269 [Papilio xuthus]|uniref:Uncharacterized protein n=1 Tax=Papilio xuthus TaxID=66420 RepID=A0A194PFP0_PAPXU|nr:hypothetical protein RR46_08269 [Papilio xuthus]